MKTPRGLTATSHNHLVHVEVATDDGENRFSPEMTRWLTQLLASPPAGARILLISARGVDFCLGPKPAEQTGQTLRALGTHLAGLNRAFASTDLITMSQIDGVAAGFGVGLACLPDFTVAGFSASFVLPEVKHGLTPALVLSWLPDYVGSKTATWLALTGLPVGAREAAALGMVSRVVPSADLDSEVQTLIDHLLGLSPETTAEINRFLKDRRGASRGVAEDLAIARMGAWGDRKQSE